MALNGTPSLSAECPPGPTTVHAAGGLPQLQRGRPTGAVAHWDCVSRDGVSPPEPTSISTHSVFRCCCVLDTKITCKPKPSLVGALLLLHPTHSSTFSVYPPRDLHPSIPSSSGVGLRSTTSGADLICSYEGAALKTYTEPSGLVSLPLGENCTVLTGDSLSGKSSGALFS